MNTSKYGLEGLQFGEWEVIKYSGKGKWLCRCSCGTMREILTHSLISEETRSCGCSKSRLSKITLYSKYGDIATARIGNPREQWVIDTLHSKDAMEQYLKEFNYKPTASELADIFDCDRNYVLHKINEFNLGHMVDKHSYSSVAENELALFVQSLVNEDIVRNDRKILNGEELDIYIPSKNIAIEFNGDYWHCSKNKDKKYHQNKTIECGNRGIRLIHIFEYEWAVEERRNKIKNFLTDMLCENSKVYARDTYVCEISNMEAREFERINHLYGSINSQINIGLKQNDELIAVMTFGKPRFNDSYEYELIRLCYKHRTIVIGGIEKMFKYFKDKYNPESIITYSDITKFTGYSYNKIGFKPLENNLTEPNYVWIHLKTKAKYSRYQTQKHILLEKGLGEYGDTEDEIMMNTGHLKIYDSGNIKYKWEKQ